MSRTRQPAMSPPRYIETVEPADTSPNPSFQAAPLKPLEPLELSARTPGSLPGLDMHLAGFGPNRQPMPRPFAVVLETPNLDSPILVAAVAAVAVAAAVVVDMRRVDVTPGRGREVWTPVLVIEPVAKRESRKAMPVTRGL
ncbi:hypothetical protein HK104_001386 [Borealophlyctis nickersoniae]|nr:hypothetical protein HK104_001386 [Borealophlyctis nickersoniae]